MTTETWPRLPELGGEVDLDRDRELVTSAQIGDRAAFDSLYECYSNRLERYCLRRLGDPHEAQDVTQEAFLRAWRALPTFGGERRFFPWLSVIASNLCTDSVRRKQRFGPVPMADPCERDTTSGTSAEDFAIASADLDFAVQAYSRLSDRHRRVLDLREKSGLSYQDIAQREGIRVTTVETLIWHARQALKREFRALSGSDGSLVGIPFVLLGVRMLHRILRATGRTMSSVPARFSALGPQAIVVTVGGAVATAALVVASASGGPHPVRSAAPLGTKVTFGTNLVAPQGQMRTSGTGQSSTQKTALSGRHAPSPNRSLAVAPAVSIPGGSAGSASTATVRPGAKLSTSGSGGDTRQRLVQDVDAAGAGAKQLSGLIGGATSGVLRTAEKVISDVVNVVGHVAKDLVTVVSSATRLLGGGMSKAVAALKSATSLRSVAPVVASVGSVGSAVSSVLGRSGTSARSKSSGGQSGGLLGNLFG